MRDPDGTPFFRKQHVRAAITRLSKARNLTIFVGAGVGTEIGLPEWPRLVRRLLSDAVAGSEGEAWKRPLSPEKKEVVDLLLERESLLSAATIAKARLGNRPFKPALHRALYLHDWGDEEDWLYVPESRSEFGRLESTTVEAVAAVYKAFAESERGHRWSCDIVTTNYDLSLEEALAREKIDAEPWFDDGQPPDESGIDHVVRHLHGYLTPNRESKNLILTEADYHAVDGKPSWQESYLRRRLKESTFLFVGTSLSDPDILSVLFRSAEQRDTAFALLAEKRETGGTPDIAAPPALREETFDELSDGRWKSAGVKTLRADYMSQPRQFLWEVAMHKRNPDAPRYSDRLATWYRRAATNVPLALISSHDFIETQNKLSTIAWRMLGQVREFVREDGHRSVADEPLAIHIWCRSTLPPKIGEIEGNDVCAMTMIVCSDRSWRSPEAVDTRRIMLPTRRAAIEAFCERRVILRSHDGSFQWNYVMAIPVVITEPELGARLPVGAVTLESTAAKQDSVLPKISPKARQEVVEYLRGSASWMLGDSATDPIS